MKLRTALRCTAALSVLGLGAIGADASVINYSFSTTVDFSTFATVQAGETFTLSHSVDTAIPGSGSAAFADFNSVSNMVMTAGSFSATAAAGLLRQINAPSLDQYIVQSSGPVVSSPLESLNLVYISFELHDPTGTVISDALTALVDPSLSGFTHYGFWAVFDGGVIHGQIVRPALSEPATLALIGLGLAGVYIGRRRNHNSIPRTLSGAPFSTPEARLRQSMASAARPDRHDPPARAHRTRR